MELIHYRLKMFYQSSSVVGAQKVQIPGAVNSLIQDSRGQFLWTPKHSKKKDAPWVGSRWC